MNILSHYTRIYIVNEDDILTIACVAERFRRVFRPFEAFFAFWRRKIGASATLMEAAGRGRGGEKGEGLPANPMILKNAPLTLSRLDKFTV